MNSFNHYAYGAAVDWIYEKAAGIQPLEPGFAQVRFAPQPDQRLGWLEAAIETRHGTVRSRWKYGVDGIRYEFATPVPAQICLPGRKIQVQPGRYVFWSDLTEQGENL